MLISIATDAFRGQDFSRFPRDAQSRSSVLADSAGVVVSISINYNALNDVTSNYFKRIVVS